MSEQIDVFVIPDGPIKVSNAETVNFCGNAVPVDGDIYLCRCGESQNAPFCDGSHSKVGFKGTSEPPAQKEIRVWEGQTLRTFFNANTCMHVFYCKPLKELRERELAGDAIAATEIMKVVGECPSGALSYEVKTPDAIEPEAKVPSVSIDIMEGGEIRLLEAFTINAELHERQPENRGTLCRCGRSANKPWCDGRHKARKDFK
ncbi:MAG: CDGSH iron-sulfur domain-containing protein [Bradymonadia bacterium]